MAVPVAAERKVEPAPRVRLSVEITMPPVGVAGVALFKTADVSMVVPVIEVDRPSNLFGRVMSTAVKGWINEHGRDWDVIHIHNPIAASNLHAMLVCLFENTSQGTWGITTYQKETMQ